MSVGFVKSLLDLPTQCRAEVMEAGDANAADAVAAVAAAALDSGRPCAQKKPDRRTMDIQPTASYLVLARLLRDRSISPQYIQPSRLHFDHYQWIFQCAAIFHGRDPVRMPSAISVFD